MSGNRVTTREFYDALQGAEERIVRRLDALNDKIDTNGRQLSAVETLLSQHERRFETHSRAIDALEASDKRWGAVGIILTMVGSAIASIIGLSD